MPVSTHGLDLSFMKSPESQAFLKASKANIAKAKASRRGAAPKRSDLPSPRVIGDLNAAYPEGGFRSPVDNSWISSRSQLRAHNRRHRVDQCGDVSLNDYTASVEKDRDVGEINPKEVSFSWIPNE